MDPYGNMPIYSYLPPFHAYPGEVLERMPRSMVECIRGRPSYPAWPWAIEELHDTAWRNLQGGGIRQVLSIHERLGRPVLDQGEIIGFWADDRFVVEHWVRVDHLPPATQLLWFGMELAYWRSQANSKACRTRAKSPEQEIDRVTREARAFALCHGLCAEPDVLNAGINTLPGSVQMALF